MLVKTSELIGPALDWAVARTLGGERKPFRFSSNEDAPMDMAWVFPDGYACTRWAPSTDWSQGGPLIDKFAPLFTAWRGQVRAEVLGGVGMGDTYLIAACRAIVAAKLGDQVDVPDDLMQS